MWQDRAVCGAPGVDPEWFSATSLREAAKALTYCRRCPVTDRCAALREGSDGVWAGQVYGVGGKRITSTRVRRAA